MRPATNVSSRFIVALHARTDDDGVLAGGTNSLDHGGEVQERRDEDALAALGRGDDGARPVRRREDERRPDGLEVLARRVPEVEPGNADGVPLAAEHALAERLAQRCGPSSTSAAQNTRS